MKNFLCFLALCCLPGLMYGQTQQPDSTAIKKAAENTLKIKSLIIPALFISYGALSLGNNAIRDLDKTTKNELKEDHPLFAAHVDDYSQFAPALAVYALNLVGIKGRHNLADATGIYVLSSAIMGGTVSVLKSSSHRLRPNGNGYNSFPSGHTANVFAAAEFLNQEYKEVSPWYGYAGYTVAAATGALRMYNNKHWFSDVVAGAGIGILSTKMAYYLYPRLKKLVLGKETTVNYSMVPAYQNGTIGLSFHGTF